MALLAKDTFSAMAPFVGNNGTCADDEEAIISYLNKIEEMLWPRGDWKGTIEYGCIHVARGCFALPWNLEEVRNAWICNQPILVRDEYYQTFAQVGLQNCCGQCCFPQIIQTGRSYPYQKRPPNGYRLAVVGSAEEVEALSFFSTDYAGQRQEDSIIPSLDVKRMETTMGNLINVAKPRTRGFVRVMAWSPDQEEMEFVARYDAHQENPEFTEYKLTGQVCERMELVLRCKKKHIPIRSRNDVLWLGSTVAYEFAAMAYNNKLAGNNELYVQNLNLAEEHLEEILEDQQPKAWSPLQVKYQRQAMSPQVMGRLGYRGYGNRFGWNNP